MLIKLKRVLFWTFLLLFLGAIFFIGSSFLIKPSVIEVTPSPTKISETSFLIKEISKENESITIILVGDIMLDRRVEYMMKKNNDWRWPFLKIANDLKKGDIVFGNLEGPISDKGKKVGSIYSFRANPKAIEGLTFAGFNILSLANNHAFDYGREALEDTFLRLKNNGIDYVGAGFNESEAYEPIIKEVKGLKIAFLAYTNLGSPHWAATKESLGIAWVDQNNLEKIKKNIEKVKKEVDILIVSLHSGEEYSFKPNQFQIDFSKMAIDGGANLVVGHHPHVIQPIEKYKEGYIAYSLGNFIFDQDFSKETMRGVLLKVIIEEGKIKEVVPIEVKINQYFQPEIHIVF